MRFPHDKACDEALICIAKGDRSALSVLFHAYGRLIYLVALDTVHQKQSAEDVVQEVMLRVLKYAASYRPGTNPRAWVLKITRHCALDHLKHYPHADPLPEQPLPAPSEDPDEGLMLSMTLRTLPEEDQLLIRLHLHAGLTHREVGSVMGLSETAVRKRYERALTKLRVCLNDEEGGRDDE